MTHEIEPIEHYVEGDALVIPITVRDSGGNPFPLADAEIEWQLKDHRYGPVLLDESAAGVTVTKTDPANGEVEVEIGTGATDSLSGGQIQVVRVTDDQGNRSTSFGDITILGLSES